MIGLMFLAAIVVGVLVGVLLSHKGVAGGRHRRSLDSSLRDAHAGFTNTYGGP